jgi:hypothetical protein
MTLNGGIFLSRPYPMQIAVIGWGSLIWCPGCLQIGSRWHSDGPTLPIEFARISSDKRLTLVIHEGSPEEPTPDQQTYWAISKFEDLNVAQENLQAREATSRERIHSVTTDGREKGAVNPEISRRVGEWLKRRQNIQAAIWTGLPSNWPQQRNGKQFTRADAVTYLRELESERGQAKAAYDRAREYFSNAPSQVQTPLRKTMREERGWEDATLPEILFE